MNEIVSHPITRAIFLDRDGVLNEMVYDEDHGLLDSPRRPEDVRMIPGAGRFIAGMKTGGWKVVVITNQPGIAKDYFTEPELQAVNEALCQAIVAEGGTAWDDLLYCPHHPVGTEGRPNAYVVRCTCRKPGPGLLREAAERYGIDLSASWMVGDGLVDIQAGHRAGCRAILVTGGLKLEVIDRFVSMEDASPDAVVGSLEEAAMIIASRGGRSN